MSGTAGFTVDFVSVGEASVVLPLAPGISLPTHNHPQHQLAWARDGPLSIGVGAARWVVQRSRALWIPGGVDHAVVPHLNSSMISLYFEPESCPLRWTAPTVVDATGLVGPLLSHLAELGADDAEHRTRVMAVLWDLMKPLSVATIATILPADPLALRVALAIRRDPADPRDLPEWGREVGASARTLSRRFRAETGVGFGYWRTCERLNAALPLLGAGEPVARVARAVGYQNASAFVTAFRREVGATPAAYFGRGGVPSVSARSTVPDPVTDPGPAAASRARDRS
ncbi:helix-turn-helix domain-containing protein [Streptomyces sp. NPDC058287]|uniref:helix-turn-helix domain-containing protein n=1 Tax=Streptomyces sp. NPDC058287 TaxID=3346423 RepID=UPI0036ECF6F8